MADWVTISTLATAGGNMVLAVATFASVRSANRSARITELSLRERRFALIPGEDEWVGSVSRQWNLGRAGPRGRDE